MCRECFDKKVPSLTTLTLEFGENLIIIRNIPCMECSICGEIFFSDEVSKHLEEITSEAKSMIQEISVIDYSKVAA